MSEKLDLDAIEFMASAVPPTGDELTWRLIKTDIPALVARVRELETERIAIQNKERVLTCAYCGHRYEPGTPVSNHQRLSDHIAICPSHPMHHAIARVRELEEKLKSAENELEDESWYRGEFITNLEEVARMVIDTLDGHCHEAYEELVAAAREALK